MVYNLYQCCPNFFKSSIITYIFFFMPHAGHYFTTVVFLILYIFICSNVDYSETKIFRMLNAELADTLGNLLNRCCAKAVNSEQIFQIFHRKSFESFDDASAQSLIDTTLKLPGNWLLICVFHQDCWPFFSICIVACSYFIN